MCPVRLGLHSEVERAYSSFEEKRLSRGNRQREIGAGHPFRLPLRDRLLMLLIYYRLYATSALLGFLFDLGQTNVLKDIRRMIEPTVQKVLPLPKKVYRKVRKLRTIEEIEELFPGFKALIDATEQEIPRPKAKEKRKTHYSGKKRRRHTVKTQLTVNEKGLVVHRTNHVRGRTHDYALFKHNHPDLPEKVRPVVDLGYYGIGGRLSGDGPDDTVQETCRWKRARRREGTRADARAEGVQHPALSKERVVVEHTISRLKKFRVMADEFRNRLRHYDMMTDILSGLVNLRILGKIDVYNPQKDC